MKVIRCPLLPQKKSSASSFLFTYLREKIREN